MTNLYLRIYSDGTPKETFYSAEGPPGSDWLRIVEVWYPGAPDPVSVRLEKIEQALIAIEKRMEEGKVPSQGDIACPQILAAENEGMP